MLRTTNTTVRVKTGDSSTVFVIRNINTSQDNAIDIDLNVPRANINRLPEQKDVNVVEANDTVNSSNDNANDSNSVRQQTDYESDVDPNMPGLDDVADIHSVSNNGNISDADALQILAMSEDDNPNRRESDLKTVNTMLNNTDTNGVNDNIDSDELPDLIDHDDELENIGNLDDMDRLMQNILISSFGGHNSHSHHRDRCNFRQKLSNSQHYQQAYTRNPELLNEYMETVESLDLWFVVTRRNWNTATRNNADLQKLLNIDTMFQRYLLKMPIKLSDDNFQFLMDEFNKSYALESDRQKSNRIVLRHILTSIRDPDVHILDDMVTVLNIPECICDLCVPI